MYLRNLVLRVRRQCTVKGLETICPFSCATCLQSWNPDRLKRYVKKEKSDGRNDLKGRNFIVDDTVASTIAEIIKEKASTTKILVTIHPGPGILTRELLDSVTDNVIVVEPIETFVQDHEKMREEFPEKKINILNFEMTFDNRGNERCTKVAKLIPNVPWSQGVAATIFYLLPSGKDWFFLFFVIRHFNHNFGLFQSGRMEWFTLVPPMFHERLDTRYASNITLRILYDLFFDTEICEEFHLNDVYPTYTGSKINSKKMGLSNALHLTRLTPKVESMSIMKPHETDLFIYFLKQIFHSRQKRIIPCLEELVDDIGIRLIKEGFTMMQLTKDLTSEEFLKVFKLIPTTPEYQHSIWKNHIITEGYIPESGNEGSYT